MSLFETAKQADILALARQAGYNPKKAGGGRYAILCPVHSEKSPSCHLHTSGKFRNRVHCHGCGWDGSVIDFWAAVRGIGEVEAARELAAQVGGLPAPPAQIARPPMPEKVEAAPGEHAALYAAFLAWCKGYGPTPQKYAVRDYLAGRGLTAGEIRQACLVAVPGDAEAAAWLGAQDGAEAAGLLRGGRYTLSGYPLLFPSYAPDGRVMALQGRRIDDKAQEEKPEKNRPPKYKFLAGVPKYPYGGHSLHLSGPVYLVEGATDQIGMQILQGAACLAMGGLNLSPAALALLKGRQVVLVTDRDKAGDAARQALLDKLKAAGITALNGHLKNGNGKDPGEALLNRPAGKLAAMQAKNPAFRELVKGFGLQVING